MIRLLIYEREMLRHDLKFESAEAMRKHLSESLSVPADEIERLAVLKSLTLFPGKPQELTLDLV